MKGNVLKVLKHLSHTLFQFFKTLKNTNIRAICRILCLVVKTPTTNTLSSSVHSSKNAPFLPLREGRGQSSCSATLITVIFRSFSPFLKYYYSTVYCTSAVAMLLCMLFCILLWNYKTFAQLVEHIPATQIILSECTVILIVSL